VGLVIFGAVSDVSRLSVAAMVTFLPVLPVAALLFALPESKGIEPEQLAP
jgi:hypothetical protein